MIETSTVKSDFPIFTQKINGYPLVYLDNAATTQKPKAVIQRVVDFYFKDNSNIHRGVYTLSDRASLAYEDARRKVKDFINAEHEREIIFTSGTTESINLVAYSFGEVFVGEGDEIIISEMEHHSNIVPWQLLCQRKGAVLRVVPMDDNGSLRLDEFTRMINDRTRLVAIVHVSNVLGIVNPVAEMIATAHANDVPVLIDGAQAVPHLPVDVTTLDCDFYAFSGHKFYAETGIGILYGKDRWLEKMPPYQSGGGMISSVSMDQARFADQPLKFEAGTQNCAAAVSLHGAITYIQDFGMENLQAKEKQLYDYTLQALTSIAETTIYGSSDEGCGAISFNLEGIDPYDVGMVLDKMGIAVRTGVHCTEPVMRHFGIGGTIRCSLAIYNDHEDIDRLIQGLKRAIALLK